MHPWHDLELGDEAPTKVWAVIEVPKGSKNKYELDKKTGLVKVDRVLFSSMHYPANYGFLPQTYCEDNDPLDVLVLGQEPAHPLSIMLAKPIGVMRMTDQGEADDKIIAVHDNDPEYCSFDSILQLPPHRMKEVKRFFEDYKILEDKKVVVEDFLDVEQAREIIQNSMDYYQKKKRSLLAKKNKKS